MRIYVAYILFPYIITLSFPRMTIVLRAHPHFRVVSLTCPSLAQFTNHNKVCELKPPLLTAVTHAPWTLRRLPQVWCRLMARAANIYNWRLHAAVCWMKMWHLSAEGRWPRGPGVEDCLGYLNTSAIRAPANRFCGQTVRRGLALVHTCNMLLCFFFSFHFGCNWHCQALHKVHATCSRCSHPQPRHEPERS